MLLHQTFKEIACCMKLSGAIPLVWEQHFDKVCCIYSNYNSSALKVRVGQLYRSDILCFLPLKFAWDGKYSCCSHTKICGSKSFSWYNIFYFFSLQSYHISLNLFLFFVSRLTTLLSFVENVLYLISGHAMYYQFCFIFGQMSSWVRNKDLDPRNPCSLMIKVVTWYI